LVILVGVSNIKFGEAIVKFFIHFGLYEIYAGAKRVKILIELSFRIGLRFLEIQEVECDLIENEIKGDMYTYSCEVQTTSNENITNVKIYNQFEFSSLNNSISASCSLLIEQYLENIIEIGNKFDNLLNSTLYILEYPKISQGENQIFNISGIINGLKPKFGKVDLNLSVSAEYENKTEEKLLKCKIIDIIENNYTLSCIGSKNTNISLENAMSVIEDEILMIHFDENENSTILYYSGENKNINAGLFIQKKNGKIGTGGIVAIILSCIAVMAALIIVYFYCKKENKEVDMTMESSKLKLQN